MSILIVCSFIIIRKAAFIFKLRVFTFRLILSGIMLAFFIIKIKLYH